MAQLIEIAKEDVLAAWAVLENLAVSFDQIGAVFGQAKGKTCSPEQQHALQEALAAYITPAWVQAINGHGSISGDIFPMRKQRHSPSTSHTGTTRVHPKARSDR